jgi:hypothetical protein
LQEKRGYTGKAVNARGPPYTALYTNAAGIPSISPTYIAFMTMNLYALSPQVVVALAALPRPTKSAFAPFLASVRVPKTSFFGRFELGFGAPIDPVALFQQVHSF